MKKIARINIRMKADDLEDIKRIADRKGLRKAIVAYRARTINLIKHTMIKKSILISLVTGFACLAADADSMLIGKVVGVPAGDVITVRIDAREIKSPQLRKEITQLREKATPQLLKKVTVRLYGIDCPEKKQAFGQRAKKFASDMVLGKNVKVVERGSDHKGTIVGEVFLDDGRSLNKELLKAGLAWWDENNAKDDLELAKLRDEARKAGIGLWSGKEPAAP